MPLLALIAIFVVVPLAELYVIYQVGDAIGILPTLAILVAAAKARKRAAKPAKAKGSAKKTPASSRARTSRPRTSGPASTAG